MGMAARVRLRCRARRALPRPRAIHRARLHIVVDARCATPAAVDPVLDAGAGWRGLAPSPSPRLGPTAPVACSARSIPCSVGSLSAMRCRIEVDLRALDAETTRSDLTPPTSATTAGRHRQPVFRSGEEKGEKTVRSIGGGGRWGGVKGSCAIAVAGEDAGHLTEPESSLNRRDPLCLSLLTCSVWGGGRSTRRVGVSERGEDSVRARTQIARTTATADVSVRPALRLMQRI